VILTSGDSDLGDRATIASSRFENNQALGGAGGASSNGGAGQGGAVRSVTGSLQIARSTFRGNLAQGGAATAGNTAGEAEGGGVYCDPASALLMTACTVKGNRALGSTGRGGGIYLEPEGGGTAQIKQSVVTQNIASTEGNNIYGPYALLTQIGQRLENVDELAGVKLAAAELDGVSADQANAQVLSDRLFAELGDAPGWLTRFSG
jgi:hypothetical protein